jgi:hypothetical protein
MMAPIHFFNRNFLLAGSSESKGPGLLEMGRIVMNLDCSTGACRIVTVNSQGDQAAQAFVAPSQPGTGGIHH